MICWQSTVSWPRWFGARCCDVWMGNPQDDDVDLDSISGGTDRGIYDPEWLSDSHGK